MLISCGGTVVNLQVCGEALNAAIKLDRVVDETPILWPPDEKN